MGAYYLQPPNARAIVLHNALPCNKTCSVIGGALRTAGGGAQTEKIPFLCDFQLKTFLCKINAGN